nr:hypothetical protein [Tanacetum cinerariifolium]
MTITNQGTSFAEVKQIVAQRVANAIETIAIYEENTCVARDLMNRVEQQEDKITKNDSNKRKWEGGHKGSSSQQQNKEHKVFRAHAVGPSNKKGHQTRDCRTLVPRAKQRPSVAKRKAKITCYEYEELGHYKSDCSMWKFRNRVNKYLKEKALEDSSVVANNVDI